MARIEQMGPRRRTLGLVNTTPALRGVPDFTEGLVRGLNAFTQVAAQDAADARVEADRVEFARRVSDFELRTGRQLDELGESYDGSEPGFADGRLAAYDRMVDAEIAEAPERIRGELEARLRGAPRARYGAAAVEIERAGTRAAAMRGIAEAVEATQNAILSSPAAFRPSMETIEDLAASVPPSLRADFIEETEGLYAAAYVAARLRNDPAGLVAELDSGSLDDVLDPTTKNTYLNQAQTELEARARAAERDRDQALRAQEQMLRRQIEDAEDAAAAGVDPEIPFAALASEADRLGTEDGAALAARAREGLALSAMSEELRDRPLAEVEGLVAGDRARLEAEGASGVEARRLTEVEQVFGSMATALRSDPISYAQGIGRDVGQVDFTDPAALAQSLRNRAPRAQAVANHYGVPVQYLSDAERDTLRAALESGAMSRLEVAGALVQGLGPAANDVLAEIAPRDPMFAHVGGLVTAGADAAARDLELGLELRSREGFQSRLPGRSRRQAAAVNMLGTIGERLPGTAANIQAAADAIYEARALRNGWSPDDNWTRDLRDEYERALNEAAGATFEGHVRFGGIVEYRNEQTIAPSWLRANRFDETVDRIADNNLPAARVFMFDGRGEPVPASALRRAQLQSVGNDRYLVTFGSGRGAQVALNAGGDPYVLDLALYRDALAAERPGWVR